MERNSVSKFYKSITRQKWHNPDTAESETRRYGGGFHAAASPLPHKQE
jgi:hypothetical protein